MSFFIRKKNAQPTGVKRKFMREKDKSSKKKWKKDTDDDITSESDEERQNNNNQNGQIYSDEDEDEAKLTVQEKKLKLTKLYLAEIEREEKERRERKEDDDSGLSKGIEDRLKSDFLEQTGRLQKQFADKCKVEYDPGNFRVVKTRDNRDVVTKVVCSPKNDAFYFGTKKGELAKYSIPEGRKQKILVLKCENKNGKSSFFPIQDLAISYDNKFLAVAQSNQIRVLDPSDLSELKVFKDHKDCVTGLQFRFNSHQLFSCSKDRTVRVWSLDEMVFIETLFGHQAPITSIDACVKERAVTSGGSDATIRIWKVKEDSQLIFNGPTGCSIEHVQFINDEYFLSTATNGALSVWSCMKKKSLNTVNQAHGVDETNEQPNWIVCLATLKNTDLAATGSNNGYIKLWKLTSGYKSMELLAEVPVEGFVNSLAFTSNGEYLLAGVGKEHRMGRWWTNTNAINSVVIIPIKNT